MKIYIVRVGDVETSVLEPIRREVAKTFNVNCELIDEAISIPMEAYDRVRRQFLSEILLSKVLNLAMKMEKETGEVCIVLGVTGVDIYARGMNFIFGEAQCPGKSALISLFRLRPEFYGEGPNKDLLIDRAIKEAIHELGHALGLRHCKNPLCVMFFSLHIGMTDRKTRRFCEKCAVKVRHIIGL
ncbi:MAG: archaemetzincin family Zn-dependent metalloprotease [Candidatus Bathyarchaeia archaeon]